LKSGNDIDIIVVEYEFVLGDVPCNDYEDNDANKNDDNYIVDIDNNGDIGENNYVKNEDCIDFEDFKLRHNS
jgi:hypothetical protein